MTNSLSGPTNLDPLAEALRLEAIVNYLKQALDEATEMWRAAVTRAEGTPLLDPLEEQERWARGK